MQLIADSGSTKTNWCLISGEGHKTYFDTEGYNPFYVSAQYITNSIQQYFPKSVSYDEISKVNFYGAGCEIGKKEWVQYGLKQLFYNAQIHIDTDLLGAAKALLGNVPGFAAILGTGTNTCLYDGEIITANIDSLGFLLGDEGSGGAIGKKVLADFIRGQMDHKTAQVFNDVYCTTPAKLLSDLYREPLYNRFCAKYCKFLSNENVSAGYRYDIVKPIFINFFNNLVSKYENYNNYTFNCVGSVAFQFRDILTEVSQIFGMETKLITKSVIGNLADYHIQQKIK